MDPKDLILGLTMLLVMSMIGFYVASSGDVNEDEENTVFTQNYTASAEDEIVTAGFDGVKLDLMVEDSQDARFYLDTNRDGSFDREIENQGDGELENTTELVELGNRTYRLYLETYDDSEVSDDAYITLYRAIRQ